MTVELSMILNNSGDSCKLLDAYVIRSKGYIWVMGVESLLSNTH